MSVMRWRPLDDFVTLREAMGRLFEDSYVRQGARRADRAELAMNMWEDKDALHVVARVPGLQADDLEITVSGDALTIRGRFASDVEHGESKEWSWYNSELWYGPFERSILLPTQIQHDKVEAQVKSGVLHLTLPKSEEVKPKTIKVNVG